MRNTMPGKGKFKTPTTSYSDKRKSLWPKTPAVDDDEHTDLAESKEDDWNAMRAPLKPEDQLQLTESELKEEVTRVLTANNPNAPKNVVRYNFQERRYKPLAQVDQLAVHFSLEGNLLHKDSEEAKLQMLGKKRYSEISAPTPELAEAAIGEEGEEEEEEEETGKPPEIKKKSATPVTSPVDQGTQGQADEEGDEADAEPSFVKEMKLTNQFNFSDRSAQTYITAFRERTTMTEPPPRETFAANVTQWEIFDAYQADYKKQNEKPKEKKTMTTSKEDDWRRKKPAVEVSANDMTKIINAAKIVERMINQNTYDDVAQDFKYWDDMADEYREQEGTLLPLWKFGHDKAKRLSVTALCWNPCYSDLFVTGHGSYDFTNQSKGLLLLHSLKNPSYPEQVYTTATGVMCVDVNPQMPYVMAAGHYDGSVAIYNAVEDETSALLVSKTKETKHMDPVWQVRWQKDDLDGNANFFSISSDGRIVCWTIVKNELHSHDILKLELNDLPNDGPDGTILPTLGNGTAFDFHPFEDYLFLVGTEEGRIHVCSKAYSSTFLDSFQAHTMTVYRVAWSPFNHDLFLSCSADWKVKMWDRQSKNKEPIFSYDLSCAVSDVAWAPYSSTVFAAATSDGKVHVFDLQVNKYDPICVQTVVSKKQTHLTHLSFNANEPILIVGDDRGHVTTLKLSPNLRKLPKLKKNQESIKPEEKIVWFKEYELTKLDKMLASIREGE